MTHYLIDQDNQVIPISQNVINKSRILNDFFKRNPKKAYNLDYSKKIIDQMIQVTRGKIFKNNYILYELCQELDISVDNLEETDDNGKLNTFEVEQHFMGHAVHIFNSIYFKGNQLTHVKYTESRQPAQYNYSITIPKKTRFFTKIKCMVESFFTNMIYIDEEYVFTVNNDEFKKLYSILNDKQCVRNDFVSTIINNKMTCNDRKFKQLVDVSWKYQAVESIPEMQIIIDKFDIGSLIIGNALGIQLNHDIFDIVIALIIEQLNKENNSIVQKSNCASYDGKYNKIVEIQRDYNSYVVKIKKIYVNYETM